jgi:hypothetical protein
MQPDCRHTYELINIRRQVAVAHAHALLYLYGTSHRIHQTRELDDDAVASRLHNPTTVFGNRRVDQLAPQQLQPRNCPLLVRAGQAAVTRHVGGEDRYKLALDPLLHGLLPQGGVERSLYHHLGTVPNPTRSPGVPPWRNILLGRICLCVGGSVRCSRGIRRSVLKTTGAL